ncbi:MAG: hypothetical protein VB876_16465 [Pirellulales bacterium]
MSKIFLCVSVVCFGLSIYCLSQPDLAINIHGHISDVANHIPANLGFGYAVASGLFGVASAISLRTDLAIRNIQRRD